MTFTEEMSYSAIKPQQLVTTQTLVALALNIRMTHMEGIVSWECLAIMEIPMSLHNKIIPSMCTSARAGDANCTGYKPIMFISAKDTGSPVAIIESLECNKRSGNRNVDEMQYYGAKKKVH